MPTVTIDFAAPGHQTHNYEGIGIHPKIGGLVAIFRPVSPADKPSFAMPLAALDRLLVEGRDSYGKAYKATFADFDRAQGDMIEMALRRKFGLAGNGTAGAVPDYRESGHHFIADQFDKRVTEARTLIIP
jgi:hypothetical protein